MPFKPRIMAMPIKRGDQAKPDAILDVLMYLLLFLFAILCLRYQYFLLGYREWADESETIVAAKMMAAGMKLYSQIFNHHGPLTFLPGLLTEQFGDFGIAGHRVAIALLQVLAILSIYKAPTQKSASQKIITSATAAVVVLVFMPDMFGHMYLYQTMAGIFLVVILSQYTIPAIACPEKATPAGVIIGSALIASLPFLAITYLPVAGLLFLASLRNKNLRLVAIASALGLLANLIFLGVYGSFAGYLAFHIYLNAKILPLYSGLQPGWPLIVNGLQVATSDLAHFLALVVLLLSCFLLVHKEKAFPWRSLLVVVGLCSLLMRGGGFQGMPYFYAMLPLLALIFGAVDLDSRASKYIAIGFLSLFTLKISLLLPGERKIIAASPIPSDTEFSRLVDEFTTKKDRIIAYSFENFQYLASDRLPASGDFFYLPWQEKYNEHPKFGILINACKQIRDYAPKVMLIDKWTVWDKFPWSSYAGCIQSFLDSNYQKVPERPYYIRRDLIGGFRGLKDYFSSKDRKMVPSRALDAENSIALKFKGDAIGADEGKMLVRLGVMFGTYSRTNPGKARLVLKRADGGTLDVDFSLPALLDNRYKYFDIPQNLYTGGEIISLTGGGVSAWESHDESGGALTCLTFVFSDASLSFTPGCPMF